MTLPDVFECVVCEHCYHQAIEAGQLKSNLKSFPDDCQCDQCGAIYFHDPALNAPVMRRVELEP